MADQHAIDKLYFDIDVKSSANNAQKVEKLAQALDKLEGVLYDFPSTTFDKVSQDLSKFGNALNATNLGNKQLSGLSSRLTNLNKKIEGLDTSIMKSKFEQMATAITPFIDKVTSAQASLTALNGVINGSGKMSSQVKTPKETKKSKGLAFGLPKIARVTLLLHSFRKIGNIMGDIVTKGSDFGETLNLWQVSMGQDFLPQATEFVDKLNEAYGISKQTLMNSQAIFKNMLGSLGEISEVAAYQLSEGITQMALDYASLYNVQFEDAMTKFQAALAGQVRPIRSVAGYDITENTLYQLYQQLGGTKTMRQLSRTEKQLLSIYAVFNQMERSGAVGDLDRTMESFANQSRVMAETWNDIQTYAGLTVTKLLQQSNVMQYVNAGLIFVSRILEGLSGSIDANLGNSADPFENITDGANDAIEATEKLKSTLLSFDKFQALDSSNNEDDALGLDNTLISAINKYNSILSGTNLGAGKLADDWLEKLGGIDTVTENIKKMFENISKSNAFSLISSMLTTFSEIGGVLGNNETGLVYWVGEFFKSIDNEVFGAFKAIWQWIDDNIATDKFIEDLGKILQWLKDWHEECKNESAWEKFITFWVKLGEAIKGVYEWLSKIIQDFGKDLGLDMMYEDLFGESATLTQNKVNNRSNNIKNSLDDMGDFFANLFGKKKPFYFADGGLPNKGSMFIAGESGAELVGNMSNGQSGVMNMQQLENAVARGMLIGLSSVDLRDDRPIYVSLDGQNFLTISRDIFKRNGFDLIQL